MLLNNRILLPVQEMNGKRFRRKYAHLNAKRSQNFELKALFSHKDNPLTANYYNKTP